MSDQNFRIVSKSRDHIVADVRSWEGPARAGDKGHYRITRCTFPKDQGEVCSLEQRHARGDTLTVSQSASYWKQLARHLKWKVAA